MRQPKLMQFCKEVDAARIRLGTIARAVNTHQQQAEVIMDIDRYKVAFRSTSASQADSIRIQLDHGKTMTFRINNGRVYVTNVSIPALTNRVKEWMDIPAFIELYIDGPCKRAWRSSPTPSIGLEELLSTLLLAPVRTKARQASIA